MLTPYRRGPEVGVRPGVQAKLVALCLLSPHDLGVSGNAGTDDEEGPGNVLAPQHVEDLGRPPGVRSVVRR